MYARGWADVETHWRAFLTYVAGAVYDGESCFTVALAHGRGLVVYADERHERAVLHFIDGAVYDRMS
jgi:hypothetical protein